MSKNKPTKQEIKDKYARRKFMLKGELVIFIGLVVFLFIAIILLCV